MIGSPLLLQSGRYFNYQKPTTHHFLIEDIAHALSNQCRYTGHCREFYSIAQHSVLVSRLVPPEFALDGLMHDASEAYLGDVNTHLKSLLPEYRALEEHITCCIADQFGLRNPLPAVVKHQDLVALMTEAYELMPLAKAGLHDSWPKVEPRHDILIVPQTPAEAKASFLRRWHELKGD